VDHPTASADYSAEPAAHAAGTSAPTGSAAAAAGRNAGPAGPAGVACPVYNATDPALWPRRFRLSVIHRRRKPRAASSATRAPFPPTRPTSEDYRMTTMLYGSQKPVEGLTVMGEATRDATPELVEMFFDIHSAGPTAAMATQENANRVMQLRQALALACS